MTEPTNETEIPQAEIKYFDAELSPITFIDENDITHYGDEEQFEETGTCGSYLCCIN